MNEFNLLEYLNNGIKSVVTGISRASVGNLKTLTYMGHYAKASKNAEKLRSKFESEGLHIPPFLICSITDSCNLRCAGCFAREADRCRDKEGKILLDVEEWDKLFGEAEAVGTGIAILAGGEPLIRDEVLAKASNHKDMLFPVITNGTLLFGSTLDIFNKNRNLIPVISIEGDEDITDSRRGEGIHKIVRNAMLSMKKKGILFGASITVTKENLEHVMSDEFVNQLKEDGCGGIIYIEYVPAEEGTEHLAPTDKERAILMDRVNCLRDDNDDMLFIAFPGDEQAAGGCLAAGRGFLHINPYGGTEPCPFSPFEGANLREPSYVEVLKAPLFNELRESGLLEEKHDGGCTLYIYEDRVREMIDKN